MRVLVVGSLARSIQNFRGPLIMALLLAGHEVHAAAPGLLCEGSTHSWLKSQGVICHDFPLSRAGLNPVADLRALFVLHQLMRLIAPDVFLGYTAKPVIWGLIAARLTHVKQRVALITGLGYAFTDSSGGLRHLLRLLSRTLYWIALRSATLIFFQNRDDCSDFQRMGLLPRDVIISLVAGSGVDLSHFPQQLFPSGPVCFLLIARLLADKGIREYIAAAQIVRCICPEVEFHLVGGPDPNPAGIPDVEIRAAHAAGDVIWHGPLQDVRPILSQTHCYVLPSYREGMPRTVLEAMASGRPIITSDVPGCRETVTDGVNGFLVPPRNSDALATAMLRFIDLPASDKLRMAQTSLAMVRERFDVHKVNAQMLDAMGL